ncbi:hypothetical protein HF086_001663 [Spodoptera exigua]|uniref:Endonuclease/exonuclease/phosphatase domain-containing protein n=1 Tax=Spodoptera exigua TaxID=7107 RepID=A0A922MPT0_SPOEX|nr:hypothetical protein HF086_001663 [Spodoptera exigua]
MDPINYVTIRRHKTMTKSRSTESINNSINTSPLSCDDNILVRSLDLSTNICSTIVSDLKDKIRDLKNNLESTQHEMENVILENIDLKKEIKNIQQELNVLRQLCRSPLTTFRHNMSSSMKKTVRRRLTNSFQISPLKLNESNTTISTALDKVSTSQAETYIIARQSDKKTEAQQVIATNFPQQQEVETVQEPKNNLLSPIITKPKLISSRPETQNINKRQKQEKRAFIVGGIQCRGLASQLCKSRLNNTYNDYRFLSIIKPNASTEEILTSIKLFDITPDDKLIISIGQNDTNTLKMTTELVLFLESIECPVLIINKYRQKKRFFEAKQIYNHVVFHQNIAGAINKSDDIEIAINLLRDKNCIVDFICLTETFIKSGDEENLKINAFKLVSTFSRKDQKRGGVCILIRQNIEYERIEWLENMTLEKHFEICGVRLKKYNINLLCVYRTPNSDLNIFLRKIQILLNKLHDKEHYKNIICGDFNIDILNNTKHKNEFINILYNYNFKPYITQPTRQNTCIDNIISDIKHSKGEVHELGLSDHNTGQTLTINSKNKLEHILNKY